MAIRPILEVPDPRLKTVSTPVTEFDDALRTLVEDMFDTMYDAPGIGLAAIQVGVPKRVLVIDLQEPAPHEHEHGELCDHDHGVINDPLVFINPEILTTEAQSMSVISMVMVLTISLRGAEWQIVFNFIKTWQELVFRAFIWMLKS